jgi:hypothetical protein
MSSLLRLYPQAWRERYGDELVALLEDHPATLSDHLDLIRGALDARLHPQVLGVTAIPDKELPVNQRAFGFLAAAGGIAWILGILSIYVLPRDVEGSRSLGLAMVGMALAIACIGAALGDLGTRQGSAAAPDGPGGLVVQFVLGLTWVGRRSSRSGSSASPSSSALVAARVASSRPGSRSRASRRAGPGWHRCQQAGHAKWVAQWSASRCCSGWPGAGRRATPTADPA